MPPSRVHLSRNLELEAEAALEPRLSDMGCGHPINHLAHSAKYCFRIFIYWFNLFKNQTEERETERDSPIPICWFIPQMLATENSFQVSHTDGRDPTTQVIISQCLHSKKLEFGEVLGPSTPGGILIKWNLRTNTVLSSPFSNYSQHLWHL